MDSWIVAFASIPRRVVSPRGSGGEESSHDVDRTMLASQHQRGDPLSVLRRVTREEKQDVNGRHRLGGGTSRDTTPT